jgi:hypothetical protein
MSKLVVTAVAAVILGSAPARAADIVTNGSFTAGFSGWTQYNTVAGPNDQVAGGAGTPAVVQFNVTGTGAQSAARFDVGDTDGAFNGTFGGGGLTQTVTSAGGLYLFSASVAAFNASQFTNLSGGRFQALVDGAVLASFDINEIASNETRRGLLTFATTLSAGNHVLSIQALRNGLRSDNTPFQYFTNVRLDNVVAGVPEPATWGLMLTGFGMVGAGMRARRRSVAFSAA